MIYVKPLTKQELFYVTLFYFANPSGHMV